MKKVTGARAAPAASRLYAPPHTHALPLGTMSSLNEDPSVAPPRPGGHRPGFGGVGVPSIASRHDRQRTVPGGRSLPSAVTRRTDLLEHQIPGTVEHCPGTTRALRWMGPDMVSAIVGIVVQASRGVADVLTLFQDLPRSHTSGQPIAGKKPHMVVRAGETGLIIIAEHKVSGLKAANRRSADESKR